MSIEKEKDRTERFNNFCAELADLSEKYGIIIKSIGGVFTDVKDFSDFIGYNKDLDSGDLIPEFENDIK